MKNLILRSTGIAMVIGVIAAINVGSLPDFEMATTANVSARICDWKECAKQSFPMTLEQGHLFKQPTLDKAGGEDCWVDDRNAVFKSGESRHHYLYRMPCAVLSKKA